jgi:mRNA interferase RelE/StbE
MYDVLLRPKAQRQYKRLAEDACASIAECLEALEQEPRAQNVKKLGGEFRDFYRARVGDWRIVFTIDDEHHRVDIASITLRKDAPYA